MARHFPHSAFATSFCTAHITAIEPCPATPNAEDDTALPSPRYYLPWGRRLIELGSISEGQDLIKFMLVARDTDRGRGKMLDCYGTSPTPLRVVLPFHALRKACRPAWSGPVRLCVG